MPTGFDKFSASFDMKMPSTTAPARPVQAKPATAPATAPAAAPDKTEPERPAESRGKVGRPRKNGGEAVFNFNAHLPVRYRQVMKDIKYRSDKQYTELLCEALDMLAEKYR